MTTRLCGVWSAQTVGKVSSCLPTMCCVSVFSSLLLSPRDRPTSSKVTVRLWDAETLAATLTGHGHGLSSTKLHRLLQCKVDFHHVVARSNVLLCIIMKIMLTLYFFKYIPHYNCWEPWPFRSHCTPLPEKAQMTSVIITELLLSKCFQYFSWKGIFSL